MATRLILTSLCVTLRSHNRITAPRLGDKHTGSTAVMQAPGYWRPVHVQHQPSASYNTPGSAHGPLHHRTTTPAIWAPERSRRGTTVSNTPVRHRYYSVFFRTVKVIIFASKKMRNFQAACACACNFPAARTTALQKISIILNILTYLVYQFMHFSPWKMLPKKQALKVSFESQLNNVCQNPLKFQA
jgi:hypothetical protein